MSWFHRRDIGWLFSPTRKWIDIRKRGDEARRGQVLRRWSLGLFYFELVCLFVLSAESMLGLLNGEHLLRWLLLIYGWSRCNEIAYAFYRDVLSRLGQEKQGSNLTLPERTLMAMRSFFGLAFNFALLYYYLPLERAFEEPLSGFFEAFYFSAMTLTTVGYGDIIPKAPLVRLFVIYEVFAGILIIAVAIATYIGSSNAEDNASTKRKL